MLLFTIIFAVIGTCLLPKITGATSSSVDLLCKQGGVIPKCAAGEAKSTKYGFYFDKTTSSCLPYQLKCSAPDFKSIDDCLNTCKPKKTSTKPLDCYRPLDESFSCPINVRYLPVPHVKYNPFNNKCEPFNASCPLPLDGNNIFRALDECKLVCQPKDCSAKLDLKKCKTAKIPIRTFYTFDKSKESCQKFSTTCSSVSSNDLNVFETKEDCKARCIEEDEDKQDCGFKVEPLECGLKDGKTFTRYTFQGSSCVQFETNCVTKTSGKNIFETLSKCRKTCETKVDCSPELRVRQCQGDDGSATKTYYTYRSETEKCEKFTTFCKDVPKKNVFQTMADCQKGCEPKQCSELDQIMACMTPNPQLVLTFYSYRNGKCEKFQSPCNYAIFNNAFITEEDCKKTCAEAICKLPKAIGTCRGYYPRFYYDKKKGKCLKFIYSGCEGNGNSFETLEDCRKTCLKRNDDSGSDSSSSGKDSKTRSESTDEDESKDEIISAVCKLPKVPGPCKGYFPRFYYDQKKGKCVEFIYGGCEGNGNNFKTLADCRKTCRIISAICKLPKAIGNCRGYYPRFFYDKKKGKCLKFIYSGCDGNRNNFETLEDCRKTCLKRNDDSRSGSSSSGKDSKTRSESTDEKESKSTVISAVCKLPKVPGPCKGYFPRFYFDQKKGKCSQFIYGGCDGNGNNFETLAECRKTCRIISAICKLPKAIGNCRGYYPRFYYDKKKGKCLKFIYSGCDGNGNNFEKLEDCRKTCLKRNDNKSGSGSSSSGKDSKTRSESTDEDESKDEIISAVCKLPKVPGPCKGYFPRFYYDQKKGKCVQFIYGGCDGNGNNFEKLEDCRKTCWKKEDESGSSSSGKESKSSSSKDKTSSGTTDEDENKGGTFFVTGEPIPNSTVPPIENV